MCSQLLGFTVIVLAALPPAPIWRPPSCAYPDHHGRCFRTGSVVHPTANTRVQLAWLPRITARLRVAMPRARLRVVSIDSMLALGDLASPEVDLHVGVPATGPGIHAEPLTRERTVLVARRRHPAAGKRLSPTALGALAHVVVQLLPGRGLRDHATAAYDRAGIARDVVVAVPSFTAAAAIAAGTELVATIPQSILATHGRRLGLVALRTPLPETSVPIALCWHERTDDDPAARALRELVRAAITAAR